ncbi:MAG: DUF1571 domain-containing protein [Planctomycetaceae bacterium]|nr:DUF1571 domain-containing protein [Planctomycetaceae bacterium]
MTKPESRHDSQQPANSTPSRKGIGWLIKSCMVLVVIAALAYVANQRYQQNVAAKINPDQTRSVEIVSTGGDAGNGNSETEITGPTAAINDEVIAAAKHPLLPLLDVAQNAYEEISKNVKGYQSTLISQVRVDGQLKEESYIVVKIRHACDDENGKVPFSVYTRFLKPANTAGQEAIWVSGENEGKIVAHPAGLFNLIRVKLDPDGSLAMKGNRYSIRDIGMKNLLKKMLEKGEAGLKNKDCQVQIERNVRVGETNCTMLEIVYPEATDNIDFHKARIFIDDVRGLPIAYEGYLWPEEQGGEPPLLEKYIYTNIELNPGFTDATFDPDNSEYNYPGGSD